MRHRTGLHFGRWSRVSACGRECRYGHRRFRSASVVLLGYWHELFHGSGKDARSPHALGQDCEAVQPQESQIARSAHPLPNFGMEPYRAGSFQQCGPYLHRGNGRRSRPYPEPPHQRTRRSHRASYRFLRTYRAQHADLHSGGNLSHQTDRPVGRQLLCGSPHK